MEGQQGQAPVEQYPYLGCVAEDRLTGFRGTIIGEVHYLTGCNQFLVIPGNVQDGKYPDAQWLDDSRVKMVTEPSDAVLNILRSRGISASDGPSTVASHGGDILPHK